MLSQLQDIIKHQLPGLLESHHIWDSLCINKRLPRTYRVWTLLGDLRLCLHKFDPCDTHEAFDHPHPWPGAFVILDGAYKMRVGYSKDRESGPEHVAEFYMPRYSGYEITNPLTWHAVIPQATTYTVMLNSPPFARDVAHTQVRIPQGEDLDRMTPMELQEHLDKFKLFACMYEMFGVVKSDP